MIRFLWYSNNQGLGKCYQPWPSIGTADTTLISTLIIPDATKTSPNNCLKAVTPVKPLKHNYNIALLREKTDFTPQEAPNYAESVDGTVQRVKAKNIF